MADFERRIERQAETREPWTRRRHCGAGWARIAELRRLWKNGGSTRTR